MRCRKCGRDNRSSRKFCADCGAPIATNCGRCGASNQPGERFCGDCGASLSLAAPASDPDDRTSWSGLSSSGEVVDGERKTITALFADIKGSTELVEELDPEEAQAIVDPALKMMIEAVRHYDGYIVQSTGDGIFALFGAPAAHEDHPQRALYAALRIQDGIRRHGDRLRSAGRAPLQIRIGINSGEVVMRSIRTGEATHEYAPIGVTANLAARLQTLANPGSTVIAESTRRLVEGYFALRPLGTSRVKGISEPVNIYEVVGLGPLRTRIQRAAGRGLTRFVGRELEMKTLKHAAELARQGHGQIVAVAGDPGVGKSRLLFEFKATSQNGWMVLETFSVSYGKASAYLPLIELLQGYFKISTDDDMRTRREKITGRVLALDRTLEDTLPYLFALLGMVDSRDSVAQMDAQVKKRRTLEAVTRILLRESLNQPLTLVFEDLHWVDDQTQELLNSFADSIACARVLLLVNYRSGYISQWSSKSYYTELRLDPLGDASAEAFLSSLLGDAEDLQPLKRLIINKAEGTPFFMEETVQMLFDEGSLVRDGLVRATRPVSELKIPPTVQAILASRIDRLPSEEKELLQTLAVIGWEFTLALVGEVTKQAEEELRRQLDDLQTGDFIYEQPAIGELEYAFKHALTQEVAYGSLLVDRRRTLHKKVAAAIETVYQEQVDQHVSELAHHYQQGGDVEKAVHCLKRAAEQIAQRSAVAEAHGQLNDAITLLRTLPPSQARDRIELGLHTALATLLTSKSVGAPEREPSLRRAYELSQRVGNEHETIIMLWQLCQLHIQQLRLSEALQLAQRSLTLANVVEDPVQKIGAWHNVGETYFWTGKLKPSRSYLERAFSLYEATSPEDLIRSFGSDLWLATAFFLLLADLILSGPENTLDWETQIARRAAASKHPYSKALGMLFVQQSAVLRGGDSDTIQAGLTSIRQLCDEYGFPEVLGWVEQFEAYARFRQGDRESAIRQMIRAIGKLDEVGSLIRSTWRFATLAQMQHHLGDHAALTAIVMALEKVEGTNERWCEAEVYRIAAEIGLQEFRGDSITRLDCLARAIEIAREQGARWWELRAATSLARQLAGLGRSREACVVLGDICKRFNPDLDSADLKAAVVLLGQLQT
ncbi:MAG: AAA family ATPase [Deltaproteobacteria bacterium]|nr:AAA family ATPase [Deltaproteobacteria bacterium]